MLRRNKKGKPRLPTEEEFLKFVPTRADFEWKENSEGIVEIIVPKFNSNFGKSFLKTIKKDQNIKAKLDEIGTVVWKNCNGKKTVKDILKVVEKKFPKQENLNQRLFLFLGQMKSLNYISY